MLRNSRASLEHEGHRLWHALRLLRRAPRELWLVFLLKLLESYAYFSISQVLTIFLTEEFHMDDKRAGLVYGVYGAVISVYGMLLGSRIDALGVRASLQLGFALSLASRTALALTSSRLVLYFSLLVVLPLSGALGIPVMVVAVRRLTDDHLRGFAFGIFYATMNIGALGAGPAIDLATTLVGAGPASAPGGMSANRAVLWLCAAASGLGLLVSLRLRDPRLGQPLDKAGNALGGAGSSLRELAADRTFMRFFALSLLMVNLRGIFRHLDATLPKYLVRVHGPAVSKGLIYAINPAVIVGLVPVITAFTSRVDAFKMIILGAYVSASSASYLVVSDSLLAAVGFVLQLSLGEALWSPRFLDYQVTVAPEGKEAAFMALANAPLFLSKLPVGYLSGFLLQEFCPLNPECAPGATTCLAWVSSGAGNCAATFCATCPFGRLCDATCGLCADPAALGCVDGLLDCPPARERRPHVMWLTIVALSMVTPVLVHLFQHRLREPAAGVRDRYRELKRNDSTGSDIFEMELAPE